MPGGTRFRANKSGQRNRSRARGKPPDDGTNQEEKKKNKKSNVVKAVAVKNEHAEKVAASNVCAIRVRFLFLISGSVR